METLVFPGDLLKPSDAAGDFVAGSGAYLADDGAIRAALVGTVVIEETKSKPSRVCVKVAGKSSNNFIARDFVIDVGDCVTCRVIRTNYNQAFVDVLMVGDVHLPFPGKAVIRKEDVRKEEIDKVIVKDFFTSGDIVKAKVISLGDTKHYFLSTAGEGLGVIEFGPFR